MASYKSHPSFKIDELKEGLDHIVSTILDEVQHSIHETRLPVAIDAEWLASRIRANFPNTYRVYSNDKNNAAEELANEAEKISRSFGAFGKLPREIRDIIFTPLIAAGDVAITRTSQALHYDTSSILLEQGICRMNFAFRPLTPTMNPSQPTADTIQNISIKVNTRCYPSLGSPAEVDILKKFAGSDIHRKSCRVVFENYWTSTPMVCYEVLNIVATFTGFTKVILKIVMEDGKPLPVGMMEYERDWTLGTKSRGYDKIYDMLQPTLGEAFRSWDDEDEMVYYPGWDDEDDSNDA